jgi:hypothetical protein
VLGASHRDYQALRSPRFRRGDAADEEATAQTETPAAAEVEAAADDGGAEDVA